jgi:hypothetical protein
MKRPDYKYLKAAFAFRCNASLNVAMQASRFVVVDLSFRRTF